MNILLIWLCFLNALPAEASYNILGLFPFPARSHYLMFEALLKELVRKGHEVDVLSHFPQEKSLPGFKDYSIKGTMMDMDNAATVDLFRTILNNRFNTIGFVIEMAGVDFCEQAFNTTAAIEIKSSTKKYDLVITELFGHDCMLAFAFHFKVPVIIMTSSVSMPWGSDRFANPDNPAYISTYFGSYIGHMSVLQRLDNTLTLLLSKLWYSFSLTRNTVTVRKFFGEHFPDMRYLLSTSSLFLVNSHYSLTGARPNVPSFVEVGGLHIPPTKPLPQNLEQAINITHEYKGAILFSLGSMILTETLPHDQLVALFEAFSELPYLVLWKGTRENITADVKIPSNIYFEKWIPQLDLLCHPNLKLFITHGGLMGSQEAVYCGVPCLGIPLFADQELNVKTLEIHGLALSLNYDTMTKESVLAATKELLYNPRYKENAEIASLRFRDRPLSALDTAVYWTEYVIRHNGTQHMKSSATDLSWYEYHLLDVGLIIFSGVLFIVYTIYKLIYLLLRGLCGSNKILKQKVN